MNNLRKIALGILIVVGIAIVYFVRPKPQTQPAIQGSTLSKNEPQSPAAAPKQVVDPIADAPNRVTKKPFGIYITPKTSPVQPEKFMGYHTGTDFETFPSEANAEVPFYAICTGKILIKRTASGYGGVFVQSCTIDNQAVTIVYGHVSLKSIAKNIGGGLSAGEQIGFLGQPPTETDGERKHLHLGIHKGIAINIAGYVQVQSELSGWFDWQKL